MIRKIEIVNSKEDTPTLCIDNIYLHSRYYPAKEAEIFIKANEILYKNKNIVLVYGLGLGYHVKELLKRVTDDCKVYVFDADEKIVEEANKLEIIEDIKKDSRVELITNYSHEFLQKLALIMSKVNDILIYKVSVKILPDEYRELKELLEGYNIAKIAVERFKDIMEINYETNKRLNVSTMKEFYDKINIKGEKVIVVAAGPSLDYSIGELQRLNGKIKIFCVGSALRMLMKNNIKPDMVAIIDPQEIVYNQLKGYEDIGIPLCFLITASKLAVEKYSGPKYMFYNEGNDENLIINTGKTVAVATLDIAIKGGAKEIIFVGQDLGFLNNKGHFDSHDELYGSNNSMPIDSIYRQVLSVDGEMINTNEGYLHFKTQIEKEIRENPNVRFINCSKGARIQGTIEMELESLTKQI